MRWRTLAVVAALAGLVSPVDAEESIAEPDDGDGPVRFSLPTEDDVAAWRRPGFRLQLGVNYGALAGLDGAPGGQISGAILRVGARLDPRWSLLASFNYASASTGGGLGGLKLVSDADGLSGLRFAGTLDPTWHLDDNFDLAIGLGFGGIVEGRSGRPDPDPEQQSTLENSYTFPHADPPLPSCQGVGVAGLVRLGWTLVIGPRAATGLALEFDGQWTGCVDDTGRVEPDTARPIVRRQWWPHLGGTLAWTFTWR